MDPGNQRKLQGKKRGEAGGEYLKSVYIQVFPIQTLFFTKAVKLRSKELQKHGPECYCSNKEAAETQHSGYPVQCS